jgi:hypothetical protein
MNLLAYYFIPKNTPMKKERILPFVFAATFYLVTYLLLLSSNTLSIAIFLFSVSPIVIIGTVVAVLKQETKSRKMPDEYMYEDVKEGHSGESTRHNSKELL